MIRADFLHMLSARARLRRLRSQMRRPRPDSESGASSRWIVSFFSSPPMTLRSWFRLAKGGRASKKRHAAVFDRKLFQPETSELSVPALNE